MSALGTLIYWIGGLADLAVLLIASGNVATEHGWGWVVAGWVAFPIGFFALPIAGGLLLPLVGAIAITAVGAAMRGRTDGQL